MHRNTLLKLLESYDGENDSREVIIDFVKKHPDCFERSNEYGHITSSSWLLSNDLSRVLLTHHRKLNKWLQPGGHCDGESNVKKSALREAEEESGILGWQLLDEGIFDLDVHVIPARKTDPEHFHFDVRFIFRASESEDYIVSEESHDLAWVPLEKILEYTDEQSILRMAEKTSRYLSLT
ncbi:MAG: NUDIX hydrolase [Lentisphaeraceae bacterium]|nr:NUDIX hydrolase [Lentisphaeraceae bacterium]